MSCTCTLLSRRRSGYLAGVEGPLPSGRSAGAPSAGRARSPGEPWPAYRFVEIWGGTGLRVAALGGAVLSLWVAVRASSLRRVRLALGGGDRAVHVG